MFRNARRRMVSAAFIGLVAAIPAGAWQDTPRMTVFSQVVAGGPWSSEFFITNQGLAAIPWVELSLFKDNREPMVVTAPGHGAASRFKFDLQPGGTVIIRAARDSAPDVQGFAELLAPSGASLSATMIIRFAPGGRTAGQVGVPEQFPFSHFSFPGELGAEVNTGMAIAIPTYGYDDIPGQRILVSLLDPEGVKIDTKELPLTAGGHAAFFLREIFPDLRSFSGRVMVSGSDWLGVTALRIEGETLGTVAVSKGVALAPFFVNAEPVTEVEPNDLAVSAQEISPPAVVRAVVGPGFDVDTYRFTGRRNEILSAMIESVSADGFPSLDSELSLLAPDGSEISWNDQNGSGGRSGNDSLIRAVLPADGTYRIRVSDSRGSGGEGYTYKLHLKVQTP
jgi:hypothetical protein